MLVDTKQLRWLGMDMGPRWLRRVAVVLTYAAFLVAVWVHPPKTFIVLEVLFFAQMIMSGLWRPLGKVSVWAQRAVVIVLLALGVSLVWVTPGRSESYTNVALYAAFLMIVTSVVGWGKLVEASGAGWMGQAVAQGEAQSWRRQRRLARSGFAVGLDGFAWYEYGMRFKKLTGEQQMEIEQMRRANLRGKWMRERQTVLFNDERMRQEDYRMKARVQRMMSVVLIVSAMVWSLVRAQGYLIRAEMVVAWAWTVAVLSVTLRQAIVLWTEDDPRVLVGEMELVEREA
jgi:hypothetical protein